jgi:hypothetical protein
MNTECPWPVSVLPGDNDIYLSGTLEIPMMDPKTVHIVQVVAGILLVLTGIIQIMNGSGIIVYLSTIAGFILAGTGLYGLKTGKVF